MFAALKRLNIYQKEMYPIISRLLLGYLEFGEIYFIILLNHGIIDVKSDEKGFGYFYNNINRYYSGLKFYLHE